jgi:hypothetical protein
MLMIQQRLVQGKGTLSGAVQQLLSGRFGNLVPDLKRIRKDEVVNCSAWTGHTLAGDAGWRHAHNSENIVPT